MFGSPERLRMFSMNQVASRRGVVVVSGQAAWVNVSGDDKSDGREFPGEFRGVDDALAQSRQVFVNIKDSLNEVGASLADVVLLRCYLQHRKHYEAYREAKVEAFLGLDAPCGTTIVAELLDDRILVEVEAMAVLPDGSN